MEKLNLLIVEGNTKEENINFRNAGCIPQSENFKKHIQNLEPHTNFDIVEPGDEKSVAEITKNLKKYDGIVFTGSTLRVNEVSSEVKKHINFAKMCFKSGKKIFAACWGLQITVTAAGGKCRVSPNGANVGIASDIEFTSEGKKHKIFNSKPNNFTTPAFNYDEVETPPNNSILLASSKVNKFAALDFVVGSSEIWGIQYHPEIPYDYMIKLIRYRSKGLINKKVFNNEKDISKHINFIEEAKSKLSDGDRTCELKNWLNYLKN